MKAIPGPEFNSLFPIWLMRSKVYPTRQRVDVLQRPSLVKQLDACLDATLSLVCAPAGYGKSTLYADWRNKLLLGSVKACWLSLEQEDNDAFQLLTYIAYSLYEGGVDFSGAGITEKFHFSDLSARTLLNIIQRVIEGEDEKIVLIFDDFENLNEETIDRVIQPLLTYAPANLHIAVASRDDRRLKVAKLEMEGLALRLPARSLNFTADELRLFFEDYLPAETIGEIQRLTEGWPVAVQMLRSSVKADRDIDRVLASMTSSSSVITTYLSEQIFRGLDSNLQNFLMDISLMDGISCELADYLRKADDSEALFDACHTLSTLVLPVEQVRNTCRLHPLFREYLHHRLLIAHPDRASALHLRAADWFAGKGNLVRAVRHAVQAGNSRRALEIIEQQGGVILWLREGLTRLRTALGLLDENTIAASPRITAIRCILDIREGQVYQARKRYDAMLEHYRDTRDGFAAADRERIDHEIMLVESLLACYEGKMQSEQFCSQFTQNISRIDRNDHASLGYHHNLLCFAYAQRGKLREARYHAGEATREYRLLGSYYGEAYINFHLGDISFAEGNSEQARSCYQAGLNLCRRHFNDDMSIKLVARVLTAELNFEMNQLRGLSNMAGSIARQLEEREAWFDIYAAGYTTASNVEFTRHGIDAADAILNRSLIYAGEQKLERLINLLLFQRMDLLLRAGLDEEAQRVFKDSGLRLENYRNPGQSDIAWRERHAAVHAIILLQIRGKQHEEALAALSYFSRHAESSGHLKPNLRYEILKSLAYRGKNDYASAFKHLEQALRLSVSSGFVRSFIDAGSEFQETLQLYMHSPEYAASPTGNRQQAEKIAAYFSDSDKTEATEELLSRRESEVLKHLARGLSNKLIARNIGISENTIRFHLKNIYHKLQVHNRLLAISAARERKII